jgi:hypothetical protein
MLNELYIKWKVKSDTSKEEIMNIFKRVAGTALFVLLFVPYAAPLDGVLDVYIRVYKIPRIQYWAMELPGGNGETTSVRVDGDLTEVFPDGIVYLQTDLSPMASNSAITQIIKERIFFGGNNFKATRIRIEDLKKVQWRFDESRSSEEVRFEKEISSHSKEDYELWINVKSMDEDGITMKIRFDSGRSSYGGRISSGIIGTVFNQSIIVPEHKILLIGFPSHDKGPRGTVFWLAISAIKN